MNNVSFKLLAAIACVSLSACWDEHPCDPGQVVKDNYCFDLPAPITDAGSDASDAESSPWGKTCTAPTDCSGDAPICAPSPLGYCININCSPGEANAGICPAGWTCFPAGGGNPSACVNM